MSDGNFSEYMTRERDRLHAERAAIFTQQQELENQLAAINREFAAIEAYEAAKSGKTLRGPASPSSGRRQMRRGGRRESILAALREAAQGLSRGELLVRMGVKGDKAGEMSVSNALTALTKNDQLVRRDRKYHAAAS